MSVYFHSNRRLFNNGALVEPGNYGRLVRQAGESGPYWFRETVLENVRLARFPHKPSRLSSCFATDNANTALFYHQRECAEGYLYVVEIEDYSLPAHIGDFNWIQPVPRRSETMEQVANEYWRHSVRTNVVEHPGLTFDEVVTGSKLRIVCRLELTIEESTVAPVYCPRHAPAPPVRAS